MVLALDQLEIKILKLNMQICLENSWTIGQSDKMWAENMNRNEIL